MTRQEYLAHLVETARLTSVTAQARTLRQKPPNMVAVALAVSARDSASVALFSDNDAVKERTAESSIRRSKLACELVLIGNRIRV